SRRAECALRLEDLRPLGWTAARQVGEGMARGRGDDAGELAVLDPGRVEHLDVPDLVGEDDALAVTIEAAVDERPIRGLALRPGQGGAAGEQAVHEAVADVGEADEAAFPEGVIREGPRVEAGGHLAVVAESDADAFRDRRPRAAEDAGEERAE